MNPHFEAGKKLATASYGVDDNTTAFCEGVVSELNNPDNTDYGKFQKLMCKYAAHAYSEVGRQGCFEYQLFKAASEIDDWYPELDRFSDPVIHALGSVLNQAEDERNFNVREQIKEAAVAAWAPALAGGAVKNTPDLVKSVAGLGVLGGGLMGGLSWLLHRHMNSDQTDVTAIEAKRRYYEKLTKEIENELGDGPVDEEDIEQAIHDVI